VPTLSVWPVAMTISTSTPASLASALSMFFLPSARTTDLSKSKSASAWITTAWRTEAGAGFAAAAGVAGFAGAAGAVGEAGAEGFGAGASFLGWQSGCGMPEVRTQLPDASRTGTPEASVATLTVWASTGPEARAIAAIEPVSSFEIFMLGTPKSFGDFGGRAILQGSRLKRLSR
jgi:hypothetical protein